MNLSGYFLVLRNVFKSSRFLSPIFDESFGELLKSSFLKLFKYLFQRNIERKKNRTWVSKAAEPYGNQGQCEHECPYDSKVNRISETLFDCYGKELRGKPAKLKAPFSDRAASVDVSWLCLVIVSIGDFCWECLLVVPIVGVYLPLLSASVEAGLCKETARSLLDRIKNLIFWKRTL